MSSISTRLDARRLADLKRDPNHIERAIFGTVAAAVRPRDVSHRAGFDIDYGVPTEHPLDPRNDETFDDVLTPEQAHDDATDQVLSHAESVADWLAKVCDTPAGRMPLDVRALEPLQIIEGQPHLLLAVLMNGDNTQALRALHKLRELAAAEFKTEIDERAASMLREFA